MEKNLLLKNLQQECQNAFISYFDGDTQKAKVVLGGGNPNAQIMFVGEAPGKQEIEQGKPFVGSAGKNFEKFLQNLELTRNDVYVSNVVKIRPFRINSRTGKMNNRPPTKQEIGISSDFLDQEINIVNPKLIVALGNTALKRLTGFDVITNYHGKLLNGYNNKKVFCLFHPATLIYNRKPEFKEAFYNDLKNLKKEINKLP